MRRNGLWQQVLPMSFSSRTVKKVVDDIHHVTYNRLEYDYIIDDRRDILTTTLRFFLPCNKLMVVLMLGQGKKQDYVSKNT